MRAEQERLTRERAAFDNHPQIEIEGIRSEISLESDEIVERFVENIGKKYDDLYEVEE